jgi:hypothetical protein
VTPLAYLIAKDVVERMRARNYPARFAYGPRRPGFDSHPGAILVHVDRDRQAGDTVEAPTGMRSNPRAVGRRDLGCAAFLWCASTTPGAMDHDHEALCDDVADAFLVALRECLIEAKSDAPAIIEARFLTLQEIDALTGIDAVPGHVPAERHGFAVYLIRYRAARALLTRNYAGEARPTGEVTGVTSRTDVSTWGLDDDTGCGA